MIAIVSPNRIVSAGKSPLIYYTEYEIKRGGIEWHTREIERHGKSVWPKTRKFRFGCHDFERVSN